MKNDETVIDANMLVTKNTITQDQIEEVNIYLEYEEGSRLLSNLGYSFYYNLMQQRFFDVLMHSGIYKRVVAAKDNHYIDCKKGTPADKWVIPW